MDIITASWSTKLPAGYARIGISRGSPRGQSGYKMYRALQPGAWFRTADPREYRQLYMDMLDHLSPWQVLNEMHWLADGKTPALLCFENSRPNANWCHRGYVSAWLLQEIGLSVEEYKQPGVGWSHPKIPPEFRVTEAVPLLSHGERL